MNMNWLTRITGSIKQYVRATGMRFTRASGIGVSWIANSTLAISRRVGNGHRNSIVIACRNWVERTWPEAPIIVQELAPDGKWITNHGHELAKLLRRPNPFYSGLALIQATLSDRLLTGNAYWIKARNEADQVVQLWWAPSWTMEPYWDPGDDKTFIKSYVYTVNGKSEEYDPRDIVHFRRGFDPENIRKGRNDLKQLLAEIFTDEEASSYVAAVLANMGVPGVVISPEDATADPSDEDLEEIKDKFTQRFSGDNRGKPLVMKGPTKVQVLSFSPEQMKVRELRRIPEERVTAVLGIPAVVVGLGAGLDRSTYNNTAEAREEAYEGHIIPDQRLFDGDLNQQLVIDFGDESKLRVAHDYSEVRVLQQDQNELHDRARKDFLVGLVTLNQALLMIGQAPIEGPEGEARLIPNNVQVTYLDRALDPSTDDSGLASTDSAARSRAARISKFGQRALPGATEKVAPGGADSWTDSELDELSEVTESDIDDAVSNWKSVTAGTGLEDLLDATLEPVQ